MIDDWRDKFEAPDLDFVFVQLPPYVENLPSRSRGRSGDRRVRVRDRARDQARDQAHSGHDPGTNWTGTLDEALPLMRLAQMKALELPRTSMATAVDHGDLFSGLGSIHPRDKVPVAERLLRSALALYANDTSWRGGPTLEAVEYVDQSYVRVTFADVGDSGLDVRGYGDAPGTFNECPVGESQVWDKAPPVAPFAVPRSQCTSFEVLDHGSARPRALPSPARANERRLS